MAFRVCAILCLLANSVISVTPIEKVIQMLTNMYETGVKEKNDEEVRMTKFSTWCDNTQSFKTTAIKKAEDALAPLDKDIATYEADKKEAAEVRAKAHADFEELHA